MINVEELLQIPSFRKRNNAWERLTTGDILFQSLFQSLQDADRIKSIGKAREWVKKWGHEVEHLHYLDTDLDEESRTHLRIERKMEWHKVDKLTWCAEQAITHADFYRAQNGQACFASKKVPECIKQDQDKVWAWICIRTFLKMPYSRIEIPIALRDEGQDEERGFLATLCLEVVESGTGHIAHHPIDIFSTRMDETTFGEAMEAAWDSAKNLIQKEDKEVVPNDGRWRILQKNGHPLPIVKGRSASGAAAQGWYHLLRGTIPDEGIIVMAQIDHEGRLQGVDGIRAKAKAVAKDRQFDTVVVATGENKNQDSECLDDLVNQKCIDIKIRESQTINNLVTIRSQLVDDLLFHFKIMKEGLSRNRLLERFKLKLDDLRVPLSVIAYDPVRNIEEIQAREHLRTTHQSKQGKDEKEIEKRLYAQRGAQLMQHNEYSRKRERLDELEPRLEIGILLGDPGSGKTEWLKHRAYLAAKDAREKIKDFGIKLQDLCFPVYLRLSDISKALQEKNELKGFLEHNSCIEQGSFSGMSKAEQTSAAILKSLSVSYNHKMSKRLIQWVWRKINTQQGSGMSNTLLVYLDARDEVRSGQKELDLFIEAFAQQRKARIFLTSRIIGYNPFLPMDNKIDGSHRELEICPFEWDETEQFVGRFFHDDPDRKEKMLSELRVKIPIAGMAQNPLLTTLLCMCFSSKRRRIPLGFPAQRGEVYQQVLEGLLGEWAEIDKREEVDSSIIKAKIHLLGGIALHFFPNEIIKNENLDDFLYHGKSGFMSKSNKRNLIRKLDKKVPIIKEFCKDGILVAIGETMPDYMFLHLTFQEYLVALALAQEAKQKGWASIAHIIDKKVWDPAWQEVIILMAGKLEDPMPLLELLSDMKKDDYFRHRLALAVLCLPEISSPKKNLQKLLNDIATEYFIFWIKNKEQRGENIVPHFIIGLPALGQANTRICNTVNFKNAIGFWKKNKEQGKENIVPHFIIGLPGLGQANTRICNTVNFKNAIESRLSHQSIFEKALINVIAEKQEGFPLLACLSKLMQHEDFRVRRATLKALESIGSAAARPDILDRLVLLLQDDDSGVRCAAMGAVGSIGSVAARPDILDRLVLLLQDDNSDVRCAAARALKSIGSAAARPDILDRLVLLLQDDDSDVRCAAARALENICSAAARPDILDRLVLLLQDDDSDVRCAAMGAVGSIGSVAARPDILDRLVLLLQDNDWFVRNAAVEAVRKIGSASARPDILDRLVHMLLRFNDPRERYTAAWALKSICSAAARPDILDHLVLLLLDDNWYLRYGALLTVQSIGSAAARPDILDRLFLLLQYDDSTIRCAAAWAVKSIGSAAARPDILDRLFLLLLDVNVDIRRAAAEAVGKIGSAAARPDILNHLFLLLKDDDCRVQHAAAKAVGEIGSAAAAACPDIFDRLFLLLQYIQDIYPDARYDARRTLKQFQLQGIRIFQGSNRKFKAKSVDELSQL